MAEASFAVQTEVADHIGTIRFSCPPYNHVSVGLLAALADQLESLDADFAGPDGVVLRNLKDFVSCQGI